MTRFLVSAGLALGLLALLVTWGGVGLADFGRALRRLEWSEVVLALLIHFGIYVVRAARFLVLLPAPARVPFGGVLTASSAHNLAAYVLPAKTGEASLVVYLKTHCGVPPSAGLASLLVSRLLDLATLALALSAACVVLLAGGVTDVPDWAGPGAVTLLLASLGFLLAGARAELAPRLVGALVRSVGLAESALGRRVLGLVERVSEALRVAGAEGRYARAALLSLAVWGGVFAFYAYLARAVGLDGLGFAGATFGSSLAVATNLLPINAFAAFGTQEAGWALGFGLLGVDRELALSSGVAVHLVQLFDVCLMGLIAHLIMGMGGSRSAEPAAISASQLADPAAEQPTEADSSG